MSAEARAIIFQQVEAERQYQDSRWGTGFDDKNTLNDWVTYIAQYSARATKMENVGVPNAQREALVKVAALAVAALEAFERNGKFADRHYEVQL